MCALNINTFFFGMNVDYENRNLIDEHVDLHERVPPELIVCTQKPAFAIDRLLRIQRNLIEYNGEDPNNWYCVL